MVIDYNKVHNEVHNQCPMVILIDRGEHNKGPIEIDNTKVHHSEKNQVPMVLDNIKVTHREHNQDCR